eukprot:g22139.t1
MTCRHDGMTLYSIMKSRPVEETCQQQKALLEFAKEEVKKRHIHTGAHYHDIFAESCRIKGSVEVARVPGTLHFQAVHNSERTLNLAFTNAAHSAHLEGEGQVKLQSWFASDSGMR